MKTVYAILILLLVYGVFTLIRIKYILATADLKPIAQQNQSLGQGRLIRYIAAGDSTAVGEGASSVEQSYTHRIAEFLARSRTVDYKNVGVSGSTTSDVIAGQLNSVVNFNPDIITISIGANDITHLHRPSTIVANLKTIVETLTRQTNAQIYLTNIPIVDRATLLPYPYRKLLEYQVKRTNPQLENLESGRVHVIDIHEFGWDQYSNITSTFAADQFHPNDEGYNNWTSAFLNKILINQ